MLNKDLQGIFYYAMFSINQGNKCVIYNYNASRLPSEISVRFGHAPLMRWRYNFTTTIASRLSFATYKWLRHAPPVRERCNFITPIALRSPSATYTIWTGTSGARNVQHYCHNGFGDISLIWTRTSGARKVLCYHHNNIIVPSNNNFIVTPPKNPRLPPFSPRTSAWI